jgi:bacillolysin
MKRSLAGASVAAVLLLFSQEPGSAQRAGILHVRATTAADLRTWDAYVTAAERSGRLRLLRADSDPALPGRTIERLQQFHDGVPIWGADVVRDSERGVPISVFGELSPELTLSTRGALSQDEAGDRMLRAAGTGARLLRPAQLTVLRLADGDHRLAYTAVVAASTVVRRVFIDASSGAELQSYSEIHTQSAVGTGAGVLGDQKKISVLSQGGTFFADDQLRPPVLRTLDLRGDLNRFIDIANGFVAAVPSDRATDADNTWTDAGAVDAHVHVGWTYDYYFKRFGRRGLDNSDRPITNVVNAIQRQLAPLFPQLEDLAANAFWCGECAGSGLMYFGSGYPAGYVTRWGQSILPLAGALDVIAHELTHGVVDSSSGLIPGNEPGALNEAIADIFGTSVEFFYQQAGSGPGRADYVMGEDSFRAARAGTLDGIRSLSNPRAFGYPDHYSERYTGPDDDGGVHINAGIPGNAFYLAVEGGSNRTSGLAVQGVGAANRQQIEAVFYRGFMFLLPSDATFSTARAATIQAARDLYGIGSNPERAVTQAWTAVGVF